MDAVVGSGRKERSQRVSTIFSPGAENKRADAGRDSRTRLARTNSQARTETGKIRFRFPQLPQTGLATVCPVGAQSRERDDDTHTNIHTHTHNTHILIHIYTYKVHTASPPLRVKPNKFYG